MPLRKTCSTSAMQKNISQLAREGYPIKQAVAIAYSTLMRACGLSPAEMKRAKRERWTPKEIVGEQYTGPFGKLREVLDRMLINLCEDEIEDLSEEKITGSRKDIVRQIMSYIDDWDVKKIKNLLWIILDEKVDEKYLRDILEFAMGELSYP